VSLSASPDILRRDGISRSTITLTARDSQGEPVAGRQFLLSFSSSPGAGGSLSHGEIVTGPNGQAMFEFIAPDANLDVTDATIHATPFSDDFGSTPGRSVRVGLIGPAIPSAAFTFTPSSPMQFAEVAFDASGSTLGGSACGSACTYSWEFGSEASATGQFVQYSFQNAGTHLVTLTVTAASGMSRSASRTVTVGAAPAPGP
jgi:PKD repeat protein